jgi:hypothetical protein
VGKDGPKLELELLPDRFGDRTILHAGRLDTGFLGGFRRRLC